ncbi:unnamed protein product [Nezara viridula]|uniref:Uncharacterized protein n=1 Tax=Nezara viridula TaxID=85310 RepID=A0A9P0HEF2_NEZVI|nr:unnamed protein product [Nezara viridula]
MIGSNRIYFDQPIGTQIKLTDISGLWNPDNPVLLTTLSQDVLSSWSLWQSSSVVNSSTQHFFRKALNCSDQRWFEAFQDEVPNYLISPVGFTASGYWKGWDGALPTRTVVPVPAPCAIPPSAHSSALRLVRLRQCVPMIQPIPADARTKLIHPRFVSCPSILPH